MKASCKNQMIKITVSASRNYDVIMKRGVLAQAGAYINEALRINEPSAHSELTAHSKPQKDFADKSSTGGTKLCIVTDKTVDKLYGQEHQALWESLLAAGFHVHKYVFPGGEKHKNMATIESLLNYLADNKFTRSDLLLALGGGITGDITGFAAASFLRGIAFVQVPTSLLAIVDSSVGGKTGVNLNAGKNLAGAFWQPSLVLFDPDVLSTLSCDLKLDGVAEAVKAGCIADRRILDMVQHYENAGSGFAKGAAASGKTSGTTAHTATVSGAATNKADDIAANLANCSPSTTNAASFSPAPTGTAASGAAASGKTSGATAHTAAASDAAVASHNNDAAAFPAMLDDNDFLTNLAAYAIEVKRQIVEADERENDLRQLLNFGHTIAHAIEKCSNYQISHGHAVATGMTMISAAAEKFGLTKEICHDTILNILRRFQFPLDCPYKAEALTETALQDKKRRGETITLVIPESLGHCTLQSIPISDLRKFIACGLEALINPKGIVK